MARSLRAKLHNPRSYTCDCLPECFCKRSKLGHILMWYVPERFHKRPPKS